jgi:predicted porin
MRIPLQKTQLALACALICCGSPLAHADEASELRAKVESLQQQLDAVKAQLQQITDHMQKEQAAAPPAAAPVPTAQGGTFIQTKPGAPTTILLGTGEVTLYGNLDVSLDTATKGLQSSYDNGGSPVGHMGWQADIATNLSYVGLRGFHPIESELDFLWQLEAGIDISATPGTRETNSNTSDTVNGALFSRNSYIGFGGKEWGKVLIGKNETPYKTSTDRLNPFSGMWGDYRVIMGNTGGDNRVEFGLRAAHAIWYESPAWSGASFKAMYSPGQNRSSDNSNVAAGEPDCTGGNIPGSGALPPSCNDGSFGNLYSISGSYAQGPLYLTAAYEMHKDVNRTSDLANLDPRDVGDESAFKVGGQYAFSTGTTVNLLWERTKRKLPSDLEDQNERTRDNATWLALTQVLTERDSVSFGWAHAGATHGDPGQHNTPGGANPDNSANMYTVAWRHALNKYTSVYADYATTRNHPDAHYDLGAGGHGVTTDCHDASNLAAFDPTTGGVTGDGPHCFAGGTLQGVSVGVKWTF